MTHRGAFFLACVILPLVWSCGPKNTELVRVVQWSADASYSWEGKTREELVAALGRPATIKPDGKGGEVYSYKKIEVQEHGTDFPFVSTPDPIAPASGASASGGLHADFPKKYVVESKALATFWIDKSGVVYEQWVKPGLWKKTAAEYEKPQRVP